MSKHLAAVGPTGLRESDIDDSVQLRDPRMAVPRGREGTAIGVHGVRCWP